MEELSILIDKDGTVRFLHDDVLTSLRDSLGEATIKRASHVEPEGTSWTADMGPSGGPVLGPFPTRQEALDAEKAWLLARGLTNQ